jgi:hyaluronoglucosaminidase
VPRPVPVRGVIEGFYGPPWSHGARLDLVEFMAERRMNAYVYAPKSDPKHRDQWRDPYDADEAARLGELAAACADAGVRFGFAVSPGLDIDYSDGTDRAALVAKLEPLLARGVDWLVVAFDDIPNRAGLAAEQVALVEWLIERIGGPRLTVVPTEYIGTRPSPYLSELGAGLASDVDVMWTGPTVCSPRIDAADARAWRAALGAHPLLLWDNYPVNDAVMEAELHLGPYRGRTPDFTDEVEGVLLNPMIQPHASKVALATAAEFLADPEGYDEVGAWRRAIDAVGGARAEPFGALARACADGPLMVPEQLLLHQLVGVVERALLDPDWADRLEGLRDELTVLRGAERAYRDAADDPLAGELEPWLVQATREGDAGLAALRLVQQVRPVATRDATGAGRVVAPDAESAMIHAFAMLFAWTAARQGLVVVGGPRFALHPAVVQLEDGRPALDIGLAVREDASATDRLCRAALREYRAWTADPSSELHVDAAGRALLVDSEGGFRADPGVAVLITCGGAATRVPAPGAPPFPDVRLS